MKSKIYISTILLVVIVICIGPYHRVGIWLLKNDNPVHAEALEILMDIISDRVREAADLYKQNITGTILIVEPDKITYRDLDKRNTNIISNSQKSQIDLVVMGNTHLSVIILPDYTTRRNSSKESNDYQRVLRKQIRV